MTLASLGHRFARLDEADKLAESFKLEAVGQTTAPSSKLVSIAISSDPVASRVGGWRALSCICGAC
jgi:hypothetical protein